MEKDTPHRKLLIVKALIAAGQVKATANFYKSMTTFADNHIWQDVYHAKAPNGQGVYLKLTVIDDVLIVSFKEL